MKSFVAVLMLLGGFFTAGQVAADVSANVQFARLNAQQTGPAVVGAAGDYWNYITSNSGTTALNDVSNASTALTLTWAGTGRWNLSGGFQNGFQTGSTPYANLMGGYLVNNGSAQTISVSGLTPGDSYSLYIYSESDTTGRQLSVTVGSSTQTTTSNDPTASTFILNQNYLLFTGTVDGTGTISFSYVKAAGTEADINGFQLIATSASTPSTPSTPSAVPTLSEWSQMLLGLLVMTLLGWHFHKQRSY